MAGVIAERVAGRQRQRPFRYFDTGSLAIVGRSYAIFERRPLRLAGLLAWLLWLFVHIYFLIGLRNRLVVFARYVWSYLSRLQQSPGARIIFSEHPLRSFDEESREQASPRAPGVNSSVP